MLHLYATCDLQRGHCHHRNTQCIQSCAAGGVTCSVAGAQMLKIAVVFHGQLRFGPIEVATVKPLVSHGLRPSTHINTAVQLRQREPIAAQAVGKAQQHGQHRFSRRRRSVSSIAQRTQRLFPPPHTFGLTHVRFEFRDRGQRGAFSHVARGNVVRSAQFVGQIDEPNEVERIGHLQKGEFRRANAEAVCEFRRANAEAVPRIEYCVFAKNSRL